VSARDSVAATPLKIGTAPGWVAAALEQWPVLLADHANCEKKAASTAIALMFTYADDMALAARLSRLAREELRHFELADRLMRQLGVRPLRLAAGRYAAGLRKAMRNHEPLRKLDHLLCGALIEARSCERFHQLAVAGLPAPMASLYAQLQASEARHFELYLKAARAHAEAAGGLDWRARLEELSSLESQLVTEPDPLFRFHSGPPPAG